MTGLRSMPLPASVAAYEKPIARPEAFRPVVKGDFHFTFQDISGVAF